MSEEKASSGLAELEKLGREILSVVTSEIGDLIESTADDAVGKQAFLTELAQHITKAAARGDVETVKEMEANVPMLAARYKVRAVHGQWRVVNRVLAGIRAGAGAVIGAFVPGLTAAVRGLGQGGE